MDVSTLQISCALRETWYSLCTRPFVLLYALLLHFPAPGIIGCSNANSSNNNIICINVRGITLHHTTARWGCTLRGATRHYDAVRQMSVTIKLGKRPVGQIRHTCQYLVGREIGFTCTPMMYFCNPQGV